MRLFISNMLCIFFLTAFQGIYASTPTRLVVRVLAKDAKFIGSSIGGAHVVVRNAAQGQILAEGLTVGSTGNTKRLMQEPRTRGTQLSDEQSAKFETVIELDEPLFVRVEVFAPFTQRQATAVVSTTLWLIPGKDIIGDGLLLEVPGFVVNVLQPRTHQMISTKSLAKGTLELRANVVMMCGCPITQGGIWDADKIEVAVWLKKDGKLWKEVPLKWLETNLFGADLPTDGAGNYEAVVYAYQESTGNTGVDKMNYILTE